MRYTRESVADSAAARPLRDTTLRRSFQRGLWSFGLGVLEFRGFAFRVQG